MSGGGCDGGGHDNIGGTWEATVNFNKSKIDGKRIPRWAEVVVVEGEDLSSGRG